MFGPVGFALSGLLWALVALPLLWLILRAIPPAPLRQRFPAVVLLLGLKDDDSSSDHTPWWLLLLRMLAVGVVIIGLAGPVLNPQEPAHGKGPLLLVLDGSWAAARDGKAQQALADDLLAEAGRQGRRAALLRLTDPQVPEFLAASQWRERLAGFGPLPWEPQEGPVLAALAQTGEADFESYWLSDGLDRPSRSTVLTALESHGKVSIYETARPIYGLLPAVFRDGMIELVARRARADGPAEVTVEAHGPDPAGVMRVMARQPLTFAEGENEAQVQLDLPAELRGRLTRFEIAGVSSVGAVAVSDDSLRRREIALIAGAEDGEALELLSPLHYLRKALAPDADLLEGVLSEILPANPDVVILADVTGLGEADATQLRDWVEAGGLLVRFAGPHLAASDLSRREEDPLMPVRLRAGGRTVGGAMSWGAPKTLAPFASDGPFAGLRVPEDVSVSAQVLAQPDPILAERVIAQLDDGTPLVTRKSLVAGQVVLFHVTANTEWSTLPLSGVFVDMLGRLAESSALHESEPAELAGTTWQPVQVLDAFGASRGADNLPGVAGEELLVGPLSADLRPGIYEGAGRRIARNVMSAERQLTPAVWPARLPVLGLERAGEVPLGGGFLALALVLLMLDVLASLALSGRLRAARAGAAGVVAMALLALPQSGHADDSFAVNATSELVLAHVVTGDSAVDEMAHAGLRGLSDTLFFRTSIEPSPPMAVDLDVDELAFFPLLYWPITPDQPQPSQEAYDRLNTYLHNGGMILFDTRDSDIAGYGAASPNGRKLQQLAAPLNIPPLEPVPSDHVLTRSFYLLQDFPGRYPGRELWVEAAPPGVEKIEGMPFRNLNDGVTPVVIGGNDWAAAWAVDGKGAPLYAVGRGLGGERQREMAHRFGVNLVVYVLTGNYKSDQVHVPALLERLGQ